MPPIVEGADAWMETDPDTAAFYSRVLALLNEANIPFLVGGAYAFASFTGITRNTKDLDLFIRRCDYEAVEQAVRSAGYRTDMAFPHWLAKVHHGDAFVDLIFNSGNGMGPVDEEWFRHAVDAEVMGQPVKLAPVEESLWSKSFIMERERFDGADVAHLLHACAAHLDWPRLLQRFGPNWRVLMSHLVLFGFIYPAERRRVPEWVMENLMQRLRDEAQESPPPYRVCQGTLLSREQYLPDVEREGLHDGRLTPCSTMTPQDVADWTAAIPGRADGPPAGMNAG